MKRKRITWVAFRPDPSTALAAVLVLASILASWLMTRTDSRFLDHLLRQVLQVLVISLILPFLLMRRSGDFRSAGIRFDRIWLHLLISLGLAGLLFLQMGSDIGFDRLGMPHGDKWEGLIYVMVTNIVEVFFFACYLRHAFEKAFGVIAGVILAAAAFSLHHAGFQPEFLKLFLVGLFFITIVRTADHWLIAFPFWWVGGVMDVLYGSEATSGVDWTGFAWWALAILAVIIVLFAACRGDMKAPAGES